MAKNCYRCGIRLEEDEFERRTLHGMKRVVCNEEKVGFCEPYVDPADVPEDTFCLDEPWWRNP